MSLLADIENAIVTRLATATSGGQPLFATVRGASGPFRPAIRQALSRERLPAAFVIFIDEKLEPETDDEDRGPRFSILVADRALRVTSNPRQGDEDVTGAFALLEQARARLDGFGLTGHRLMTPLLQRFVDADDRLAIYEIVYRVRPIESPLLIDGQPLGGDEAAWRVEAGGPRMEGAEFSFAGIDGTFRSLLAQRGRTIVCRGRLRAADDAALDVLEAALDELVLSGLARELIDGKNRVFSDCVPRRWARLGPRGVLDESGRVEQRCEIEFEQLHS